MGKHWTKEERAYFTTHVLPKSHYSTGKYSENGLDFGTLAVQMQVDMDKRDQTRRIYTEDVLWQHYYQKVRKGANSNRNSDTFAPSFPGNATTQDHDDWEESIAQEPVSKPTTGIKGPAGEKGSSALRQSPLGEERFTIDTPPSSAGGASPSENRRTAISLLPLTNKIFEASSATSALQPLTTIHTSSTTLNNAASATIQPHSSSSSNMGSSENQFVLGGEDTSANNLKRTLGDETDNGEMATQTAAKKSKTKATELKYSLGNAPELGSDPVSPSPVDKKIKGKVSKAAAKKNANDAVKTTTKAGRRKLASKAAEPDTNDASDAAASPFLTTGEFSMSEASMRKRRLGRWASGGEQHTDTQKPGRSRGRGGAGSTQGGARSVAPSVQARGGGHQRSRQAPVDAASSLGYDEDDSEEGYSDNDEHQHHPQAHQYAHPYAHAPQPQHQYGMGGPTYYKSFASSYGGPARHGGYQSHYGNQQPRLTRPENPSLGGYSSYPFGSYPVSLEQYAVPGLSPNTASLGPAYHPHPNNAVPRPTSTQQMAPGALTSHPTSSYGLNPAGIVGRPGSFHSNLHSAINRRPSQLDVLGHTDRPSSSTSDRPVITDTNNPAPSLSSPSGHVVVDDTDANRERTSGTIYFDNGATTYQVMTCPCCKRGF